MPHILKCGPHGGATAYVSQGCMHLGFMGWFGIGCGSHIHLGFMGSLGNGLGTHAVYA